jgi:hypothetical protein
MGNKVRGKMHHNDIVTYLGFGVTDGADIHGCSVGPSIVNLSSFTV